MSLRQTLKHHLKQFTKEFKTLNRVEVSRAAILHNFDLLKTLSPAEVIVVMKSNAYGHGLEPIAEILKDRSFPYIAVDGYFEALRIREVSPQPILVMGYIHPDNFRRIACEAFTFVVHDEATVMSLGSLGKQIKIHLELETGMNRMGVKEGNLPAMLNLIKRYPTLHLEGVMTHLADADNPVNSFTNQQVATFDAQIEHILAAGFTPTLFHIAQSAGSTKVSSKYANAIRVGIAVYGINPLTKDDVSYEKLHSLQPALSVVSTIVKVLELRAGETVSYGCTFTAKHPTTIAVIPFGYYEGLPRELSNKGVVRHADSTFHIAGRICMNHTMLDITGSTLQPGDEMTVISAKPKDANSIATLSSTFGLFNYSLLTGINENTRRVII